MRSKNIIYISNIKWNYAWHRQQEMVSFLAAKGYRIVFIEPCDKRHPFSHQFKQVEKNVWTVVPYGMPYERCSRLINWINGCLSNTYLRFVFRRLRIDDYVLWIDRVHGIDFQHLSNGKYVVYDLIDELTAFGRWKNIKMLIQLENIVLKRTDLLLSSSSLLLTRKLAQSGRKTGGLFIPNGVEVDRFAQVTVKKSTESVILGFIGTISKRALNYSLIIDIAKKRPDWQLVFVGPGREDDKRILREAGVIIQDPVTGERIPEIISQFDVGIIPYNINHSNMDYVFPRKACEYLAAGIPVVSTDLKELSRLAPYVHVAKTADEFIEEIDISINEPFTAQDRRDFAKRFDWHYLLKSVLNLLEAHD